MYVWEVEYTDQFGSWYETLSVEDQDAIIGRIDLLEEQGPGLGRPAVDSIHQSRHSNMKELRAERSLRLLFRSTPYCDFAGRWPQRKHRQPIPDMERLVRPVHPNGR